MTSRFYHTSMALASSRARQQSHIQSHIKEIVSLRTMQQAIQPRIVVVPRELLPMVRLVRDVLWNLGYSPINLEFLELLCSDLELLAVMQRIALRLLGQGGETCQK